MRAHPTSRASALRRAGGVALVLGVAGAVACEREEAPPPDPAPAPPASMPGDPPHARRDMVDALRRARDAERSASDGGGRAWIEGETVAEAGTACRFQVVYEAGELGVAPGGHVAFIVPPYWSWSDPQMHLPDAAGHVIVSTEAEDVALEAFVADRGVVVARVGGRALRAGERIAFTYGAGPAMARADRYAERESRFWLRVDGDGDGFAELVRESPAVTILPGPAARLVLILPSSAKPGDAVPVRVALVDRFGNAATGFTGEVAFPEASDGLEPPAPLVIGAADHGRGVTTARATAAGVLRLEGVATAADAGEPIAGASNPLECAERSPRILWADLHGHTNLTDGTGTPEDYFAYAREVAGLDVVALTDHDHWGFLKVDADAGVWERIREATRAAHAPGEFVTLLGYEWTSWIHGHRHVVYFEDEGAVFSSIDAAYESPLDLWAALKRQGVPALTFAHHSAGGPIATNWDVPPDPELEPVTEVASVHGSSEALDSPGAIYAPVPGNFVRDALDRGYRLGFVASGDSHDGHPGLAHLASPSGGVAAILAEDLSREAVLEALQKRRCYGTNGPRIVLRAALGSARMGETLAPPAAGEQPPLLFVHAIGAAPLRTIEVIKSGAVVSAFDCAGALDQSLALEIPDLAAGDYVYVRVVQEDRGMAWSSPFFVE